jgi:hypothetical protein
VPVAGAALDGQSVVSAGAVVGGRSVPPAVRRSPRDRKASATDWEPFSGSRSAGVSLRAPWAPA